MISVFVDTRQISEAFELDPAQINDLLDYTVKRIANRFSQAWEVEANQTLKSSRVEYISSIIVQDEGFAQGSVKLVGWLPNAIESGLESFDLKPYLLAGPNAKKGENGMYNTVPYAQGAPGSLSENFANIMPEQVHEVAKEKPADIETNQGFRSQGLKPEEIPAEFQSKETKKIQLPKSKEYKEFTHKSGLYEGLVKNKDRVTGQNSYVTFRRVSENSDELSWIHPGIQEANLAEKALDAFDIEKEAGVIIDDWFDQIL